MFYFKRSDRTPSKSIWVVNIKGVWYPQTYQDGPNKNGQIEVFIRGEGWKRGKKIELAEPFMASVGGNVCVEFNEYLTKWGAFVTFYSITGYALDDNDCCAWSAQTEFRSIQAFGVEYICKYTKELHEFNQKIYAIIMQKHGVDLFQGGWNADKSIYLSTAKNWILTPSYSIMSYFLVAPHVDVLSDDSMLFKLFTALYSPETDADYARLPESLKDRLTFLFSEEVSNEYERLLNAYPLTATPEQVKKDLAVSQKDLNFEVQN